MLRKLFTLAVIAAAIGLAVFWFITMPATVPASALGPHTPNLDNGRSLFFAGGCASCHATPNQEDRTRLGGGVALKSPFGTFYAPNISPDRNDGIGTWSEADFVTAMLKGTSPDGRHYYPAFPYTSYQRISVMDLLDMFAFLKTLPAAQGRVRDHDVSFPFNIRRLLGGWKFLFLDGEPFRPDPTKTAAWNRGAYLINGPGHCAECHSPRNIFGGIITGQRFAGGPSPDGEGFVPNITQHDLGSWSEEQIAKVLETGDTPGGDTVGGEMGKVVGNTSKLRASDRAAMAAYIKSLPAVKGPKPPESK
jgi:mono/diheme cytochrome c family protein